MNGTVILLIKEKNFFMGEIPKGIPFKVEQSKNNRNVAKYRSGASLSMLNDKRALNKNER